MNLCASCVNLNYDREKNLHYCEVRTGKRIWLYKGYERCESHEEVEPNMTHKHIYVCSNLKEKRCIVCGVRHSPKRICYTLDEIEEVNQNEA